MKIGVAWRSKLFNLKLINFIMEAPSRLVKQMVRLALSYSMKRKVLKRQDIIEKRNRVLFYSTS